MGSSHIRWVLIGGSCFTRLFGDAKWRLPWANFHVKRLAKSTWWCPRFRFGFPSETDKIKPFTRFFPVTFLGGLSDPFRGEVTSIWVIKRSLGRRKLDALEQKLGLGSCNILQQEKHVSNIREKKQKQRNNNILTLPETKKSQQQKHWGLVQIQGSFWDMFAAL